MFKHEARKNFLCERKALPKHLKEELNSKIATQLLDFLPEHIKTVHIYLPITSKFEIDTWPIIHGLWSKDVQVVVPKIEVDSQTMSSWLLTQDTKLKNNKWQVPEPVFAVRINESVINGVVLPLLAFDKKGYRIGYGKGYYDIFLAALGPVVLRIGLSFFPPVEEIEDLDYWDIPMNYCITPEKIFKF